MFDHPDRELRQLLDLVTCRLTRGDPVRIGEHPATLAARRPVLDYLIDRGGRQQLAAVALVSWLGAGRG
jgi:hypothetical protein